MGDVPFFYLARIISSFEIVRRSSSKNARTTMAVSHPVDRSISRLLAPPLEVSADCLSPGSETSSPLLMNALPG